MTVIYKDSYFCHSWINNKTKNFSSLEEAIDYAWEACGAMASQTKPFPNEETYMIGPGDGSTSFIIRRNIDMDATIEARKNSGEDACAFP